MERILITGAQGFQGRYLAAHLLEAWPQATVHGIGRSHRLDGAFTHHVHWGDRRVRAPLTDGLEAALASPRYHYASLDVQRQADLTGLLREIRPQVIFHMASALRDAAPDHLFRTNVEGTIYLIEAIREAGIEPPRLILGSTGFVYGRPPTVPIPEDTACAPFDLYGVSKLAAEHASRNLATRYGIPTMWARIFNLVGPGQEERHFCGAIASQAAAIAGGVLRPVIAIEPLTATRDFIDVRDAARALELVARHGQPNAVYNIASGREASIADAFHDILRLAGIAQCIEIEHKPGRPADVPRYVADISRIEALGFRPEVPLEQSLSELLDWYRGPVKSAASTPLSARRERRETLHLTVEADAQHRYPVLVEAGLLESVPRRLKAMFPTAFMAVLTDTKVYALYGRHFLEALRAEGIRADVVVIPEGERSKADDRYLEVVCRLHDLRFDRRAVLINFGGGLVTDVGGFVAASYMRGVAYVNVATTLLGQHDAAVGGKVAVNMPWAKNFLGAFYHPRAVFCDPRLLTSLSDRDLAGGIAEAFKVAMCCDAGLFELLEAESDRIRVTRDPALLGEVVARSIAGKAALLAPDPYERNLRRALNLGHTFGHALEVQTGFDLLLHGEAVGFGLAVSTAIARRRGVCSPATAERIYRALSLYGLPPRVPSGDLVGACKRLEDIRLVRGMSLNFVMPREVGRVEIVAEVAEEEFIQAIADVAAHPILGACVVDDALLVRDLATLKEALEAATALEHEILEDAVTLEQDLADDGRFFERPRTARHDTFA